NVAALARHARAGRQDRSRHRSSARRGQADGRPRRQGFYVTDGRLRMSSARAPVLETAKTAPLAPDAAKPIAEPMRGARILLECLLKEGADTIFGYPGGAILHVYDELSKMKGRINH